MVRRVVAAFIILAALVWSVGSASAGSVTPHLISFQGRAFDTVGNPLAGGDVVVRIYDAATGGTLVYDSGGDFDGAIQDGVFDVLLGGGETVLTLDNTQLYHLELDLEGDEVVGDAAGGRQPFYPGGGDHGRQDLEDRITALEAYLAYTCDPGTFDLNLNPADRCEFTLDYDGIYVDATTGADVAGAGLGPLGTGMGHQPCQSIGFGLARAAAMDRHTVYVADGVYTESIDLGAGIDLKGGYYSATWERHLASTATILIGVTASGHRKTVRGQSISQTTLIEGFIIHGEDNPEPGGNSYAVWLRDAGGVVLQHNVIFAGNGGAGSDGTSGEEGSDGLSGDPGLDAANTGSSPCSITNFGGAGGTIFCPPYDISGGEGGRAECPPDYPNRDSAYAGETGSGGGGGGSGGAGGSAGWDWRLNGSTCETAGNPNLGEPGGDGSRGFDGAAGLGVGLADGFVDLWEWSNQAGGVGDDGIPGGGGGGGGAGGGLEDLSGSSDRLGGTGGGGGSGGCHGGGGAGGQSGGGSFGVFVAAGNPPTIAANQIHRGAGGAGGRGGRGGGGGSGGLGGLGGDVGTASPVYCIGFGGAGGAGGDGGHGGGGGGGAGGVAFGIYLGTVVGAPDYCDPPLGNAFFGGTGGQGGAGGESLGSPGSDGVAGDQGDCN